MKRRACFSTATPDAAATSEVPQVKEIPQTEGPPQGQRKPNPSKPSEREIPTSVKLHGVMGRQKTPKKI